MTTYYDYVLAFIPLSLLGVGGLLLAAGMPLEVALATGGLLPIAVMGHALFVNAPTETTDRQPTSTPTESSAPVSFSD